MVQEMKNGGFRFINNDGVISVTDEQVSEKDFEHTDMVCCVSLDSISFFFKDKSDEEIESIVSEMRGN